MSYKVQLINKDLGRSCLFGRVQGFSGKTYATSRYQPCGYHVAELTAEEYERAVEDISRGWQRPLCRWIPMFVPMAENAAGAAGGADDGSYRANETNGANKKRAGLSGAARTSRRSKAGAADGALQTV